MDGKQERQYKIMGSKKSDIQKLKEMFELDREGIRRYDVQLYYAILAVVDSAKPGGELWRNLKE